MLNEFIVGKLLKGTILLFYYVYAPQKKGFPASVVFFNATEMARTSW